MRGSYCRKTTGFIVVGQEPFSAAGSPEKPFCETQHQEGVSARKFSVGVVRDWVGYLRLSNSDWSQSVVPQGDPWLAASVSPERIKVPEIWSNEWLLSSNARDR